MMAHASSCSVVLHAACGNSAPPRPAKEHKEKKEKRERSKDERSYDSDNGDESGSDSEKCAIMYRADGARLPGAFVRPFCFMC